MKIKAILSWVALIVATGLLFYGLTNRLQIIAMKTSGDEPVYLVEITEFEAIRLFSGDGITHTPDSYPKRKKYTGI